MIGKILPFSVTAQQPLSPKVQQRPQNLTQNEPSKDLLKSLSLMSANSANLVPFTGKSFETTLGENYFKLPNGAEPDIFQKASASFLYGGNDVLVTAPTGTGKTAIALYAISKNLENGKKTFYTTPLKALSNEKFRDFQKIYGKENVGLITGDTKINKEAPVVIMTTEVYRNMIFQEKFNDHNPLLDNLGTVVFDELHYLGDRDRGGVWEQSIILSDPKTQLLSLSATIGNNSDIAKWMAKSRDFGFLSPNLSQDKILSGKADLMFQNPTITEKPVVGLINVPTEFRHVPLEFENLIMSGSKKSVKPRKNKEGKIIPDKRIPTPQDEDYQRMVTMLKKQDKLPAIFFVFNKKNSKEILEHLAKFGEKLNSKEEIAQIDEILNRYKKEGKYLGETLNKKALYKGYAIHNAGLLPTQKELVEELFQKKLLKVAIATETLSAGINMPARTTVITSYVKPSSSPDAICGRRALTPNEFHQMAGRAGRRGIDKIGYCYTMSMNGEQAGEFDYLINSKPNELQSAFNPDYSFVAGYYDSCDNDELINEIAKKSFYTYDNDENIAKEKQQKFINTFNLKRKTLQEFGYLDTNNQLSEKGHLLSMLNGYEQIPIINDIVEQKFGGMNAIELAASVGVIANTQIKRQKNPAFEKKEQKDFSHPDPVLTYFVTGKQKSLKSYNDKMLKLDNDFREIELDTKIANHIYDWAELNSKFENSTENWAAIMDKSRENSIRDEGSLFKEITMTIDLLKQISEIATEGKNLATTSEEQQYYKELRKTALAAVNILSKEPISA